MWEEEDQEVLLGILLVTKGTPGEKLLYMYPYRRVPTQDNEPAPNNTSPLSRKEADAFQMNKSLNSSNFADLFPTQFGLTSSMLASILCVKSESYDQRFELKVDNYRFAGYPKTVSTLSDYCSEMFSIVFVMPSYVEDHVVLNFQILSHKLALAIDSLQTLKGYFGVQEKEMRLILDNLETLSPDELISLQNPWEKVRSECSLAALLARVFDDVCSTGIVRVFVDDFIEVGYCVESRALAQAQLTPKSRAEIDKLIQMIRPYHVALFMKHSTPNIGLSDISVLSGIPLNQCFLIVRHLLLWARALVIYPICSKNDYSSATRPRPIERQVEAWNKQFGSELPMGTALSYFNPPATLENYIRKTRIEYSTYVAQIAFLLRHQLIVQLHKVCYILPPYSNADTLKPGEDLPGDLHDMILKGDLMDEVKPIVADLCCQMLDSESYSKVERRLKLFLRMAPYMKGMHHLEDITFRLSESRHVIDEVLSSFSMVISTLQRVDFTIE
ncbi:unnamed protein product [Auanema sp. JU1783]|nr:unnamed protein product [Auanema sp. JU1783]